MKNALLISVLIAAAISVGNCGQKNTKAAPEAAPAAAVTTNTGTSANSGIESPATGTYNATGTVTFTAGGVNYSCSVTKVVSAPTSLTIHTATTDIKTTGSIMITCYTATKAIVPGTYTASSQETIASVSFFDKNGNPYMSTSMTAGSACTVNLSTVTASSVKGTFTATLLKPLDNTNLNLTNGIIDCTITGK